MFSTKTQDLLCTAGLSPLPIVEVEAFRTESARIWLKREWDDPEASDPLRSVKRKPACLLTGDVLEKSYVGPGKIGISATSGNLGNEIGLLTAMTLVTEIIDVHRFKGLDELASYAGLVPGEDSSGDRERVTGITSRRNPRLRHVLIEASWVAARKDPALLQKLTQLTGHMSKTQAIIRIARKLLNRIRYVLKNRAPYELCVVQ